MKFKSYSRVQTAQLSGTAWTVRTNPWAKNKFFCFLEMSKMLRSMKMAKIYGELLRTPLCWIIILWAFVTVSNYIWFSSSKIGLFFMCSCQELSQTRRNFSLTSVARRIWMLQWGRICINILQVCSPI